MCMFVKYRCLGTGGQEYSQIIILLYSCLTVRLIKSFDSCLSHETMKNVQSKYWNVFKPTILQMCTGLILFFVKLVQLHVPWNLINKQKKCINLYSPLLFSVSQLFINYLSTYFISHVIQLLSANIPFFNISFFQGLYHLYANSLSNKPNLMSFFSS